MTDLIVGCVHYAILYEHCSGIFEKFFEIQQLLDQISYIKFHKVCVEKKFESKSENSLLLMKMFEEMDVGMWSIDES